MERLVFTKPSLEPILFEVLGHARGGGRYESEVGILASRLAEVCLELETISFFACLWVRVIQLSSSPRKVAWLEVSLLWTSDGFRWALSHGCAVGERGARAREGF